MNVYRTQFSRRCPVNGDRIFYSLTISCADRIMIEDIDKAIAALPGEVLHEDAADALSNMVAGQQVIEAQHRSTYIETTRGEP